MRVTNKMLSNNYLTDMRRNMENMKTVQSQLSSGKEVSKPSDDPAKVARVMQLNTDIDANTQFNKNILNTSNWLDSTDTALSQLGDVYQKIREKLVSAGNAAFGPGERTSIKHEINQRVGEISQILNTSFDGKYIFAGTDGTDKPTATTTDVNGNSQIGLNVPSVTELVNSVKNYATTADSTYASDGTNLGNDIKAIVDAATTAAATSGATTSTVCTAIQTAANLQKTLDATNASTIDGVAKPATDAINTINQISSGLNVEISQGVTMKYNVSATEIMSYTDSTSSTSAQNSITDLLNSIINHLDGKNADGSAANPSSASITDTSGKNTLTIADPTGTHDVTVNFTSGTSLSVSSSDATHLTIQLDNTDPLNNTAAQIQAKIHGLTGFSGFTANISSTEVPTPTTPTIGVITPAASTISSDPVNLLSNSDLQGITDAMNNLLKVRAEVGAKQNRMDSAKDENVQESYSMTEILSKTEDIDYAQKVMDFSTLQTVYMASLQTSAKIIQPSLLDYIK